MLSDNYFNLILEYIRYYNDEPNSETARQLASVLSLSKKLDCCQELVHLMTTEGVFDVDSLVELTFRSYSTFFKSAPGQWMENVKNHPLHDFFSGFTTPSGRPYSSYVSDVLFGHHALACLYYQHLLENIDLNNPDTEKICELIKQNYWYIIEPDEIIDLNLPNLGKFFQPGIRHNVERDLKYHGTPQVKTPEDFVKVVSQATLNFIQAFSSILPSPLNAKERRASILSKYNLTPVKFIYRVLLEDLTDSELDQLNEQSPTGKKIAWKNNKGFLIMKKMEHNARRTILNKYQELFIDN